MDFLSLVFLFTSFFQFFHHKNAMMNDENERSVEMTDPIDLFFESSFIFILTKNGYLFIKQFHKLKFNFCKKDLI